MRPVPHVRDGRAPLEPPTDASLWERTNRAGASRKTGCVSACANPLEAIFSMSHPARAGSGHGRLGDASLPLEPPTDASHPARAGRAGTYLLRHPARGVKILTKN